MGRFGNQAEHFLGSMTFAKNLNRTFIVPPFRTFKNVPYKEWFKLEKLNEFHRSISAEDFMEHIAPIHWPESERRGFCWGANQCVMEYGNPANEFWSQLGITKFTNNVNFDLDFIETNKWIEQYPPSEYPVLALRGAPAYFPIRAEDRKNQQFMVWSDEINSLVDDYLKATFGRLSSFFCNFLFTFNLNKLTFLGDEKFIGIHLRNGLDWSNACSFLEGEDKANSFKYFMASPQCDHLNVKLSKELCFPSTSQVLDDLERVVNKELNGTVKNVYVATDKSPLISEIKEKFSGIIEKVVHFDPWLPVVDLAILARSEYFIGNCVSSFTAFVKRERDIKGLRSAFWST